MGNKQFSLSYLVCYGCAVFTCKRLKVLEQARREQEERLSSQKQQRLVPAATSCFKCNLLICCQWNKIIVSPLANTSITK